jgi:hypothetical protein
MRDYRWIIGLALFLSVCAPARADFFKMNWKQAPGPSPVTITETSLFSDASLGNQVRACISFKNTTQKPITAVEFTFRFDDMLGSPLTEGILQRQGSFGPGIVIEGKMSVLGGNSDSFNNCKNINGTNLRPVLETVGVNAVRFEDGTTWKKGDPLPGVASAPAVPGAPAPIVNVNGASGQGGSFAPAGGSFWSIAWVPGSRKLVATAIDEKTQTDADYGALSKCNAANGGGTACQVVAYTTGLPAHPAAKCGALAIDEAAGKFASGWGANQSDTIRAAEEALVRFGGALSANSIVTVVCNSR